VIPAKKNSLRMTYILRVVLLMYLFKKILFKMSSDDKTISLCNAMYSSTLFNSGKADKD
jgi:hypothetical protein